MYQQPREKGNRTVTIAVRGNSFLKVDWFALAFACCQSVHPRKDKRWRTASEAGLNSRVYGKYTPVWMCMIDDFFTVVFALVTIVSFGGLILYGIYKLLSALLK